MPSMEMIIQEEAVCTVVSRVLMQRNGDEWLHEALTENDAWLRTERQVANLIASGLRKASDIDSVDHAAVGKLLVSAVFDYIAHAKQPEIATEAGLRIREYREDLDADRRAA